MLSLLLLLGCGGDPAADPCAPGDAPTLAIGTGEVGFESTAENEPIELVYGPQGGVHLLVAMEATFINDTELVEGQLEGWIDGEQYATSSPWLTFRCNPQTDTQQTWGTFLIYDTEPGWLHGVTTEVRATIRDVDGTELTTSTTWVIDDPTGGL